MHVGPDLSLPAHRDVFVLGDMAHTKGADGAPLPGVAQVALQGGVHAAGCIEADLSGFSYPISLPILEHGHHRALQGHRLWIGGLQFGVWPPGWCG